MVKYSYDGVGNRLSMENDEGVTKYSYNELNQLTQEGDKTFEYDNRGNLIEEESPDRTVSYSYNTRNLLTNVAYEDETYVSYGYDALGRKVFREEATIDIEKLKEQHKNKENNNNSKSNNGNGKANGQNKEKTNNGNGQGKYNNPGQGNKYGVYKNGEGLELPTNIEQTSYLYQGLSNTAHKEYSPKGSPYGEYYNANGQVISKKMFGLHGQITPGQEETMNTNGGLMYYQYDGTRNVTELTNRHGEEIEHYRYDAFGNILTGITAPYNTVSFTGHEYDQGSGLTYMNARWYNSEVGRFTSKDTYFGTLSNPQSQNQYSYVMNNPVNMWDPSGNVPSWVGKSYHEDIKESSSYLSITVYTLNNQYSSTYTSHIRTEDIGIGYLHILKDTITKTWKYTKHFLLSKKIFDEETGNLDYYEVVKLTINPVTYTKKDYYDYDSFEPAANISAENQERIKELMKEVGDPPTSEDPPTYSISTRNGEVLDGEEVIYQAKRSFKDLSDKEKMEVSALQQQLNEVMGANIKTDGKYGTHTKTLVEDLQEKYSLPKNGALDKRTLLQLDRAFIEHRHQESYNKIKAQQLQSPNPNSTLLPRSETGNLIDKYEIDIGQFNLNLQNTQDFLTTLGYDVGNDGANGLWSSATKSAINQYQKDNNLLVTEYLNEATYSALKQNWVNELEKDLDKLTISEKYWLDKIKKGWIFPLKESPTANPMTSPRSFQSDRDKGTRRHAGVDYYQAEGTEIVSMSDGIIVDVSGFFMGTFEVAIQSADGSIIRYTELMPDKSVTTKDAKSWQYWDEKDEELKWKYEVGFTEGKEIKQGQAIGQIKPIQFESGTITNMLHLEVYTGKLGYDLTYNGSPLSINFDRASEDMDHFKPDNYNRRADLLDSTWSKYLR